MTADTSTTVTKKGFVRMDDRKPLKLYHLMMLAGFIIGNEGTTVFGQIYSFLTLEYLGVPTSLATGNGIVGGCSAIFLIPLFGLYIDRGSNPKKRKLLALALGATIFLISFWVLLAAAVVKIAKENADDKKQMMTSEEFLYPSDNNESMNTGHSSDLNGWVQIQMPTNKSDKIAKRTINGSQSMNSAEAVPPESSWLPVTGILGLVGFSLLDLGFDLGNSFSRAFALDHTPPEQHKNVLMIISFLAPMAGAVVSLFGIVDFPAILGSAFSVDGTAATLMFFSVLLMVVMMSSTMCTVLTGIWVANKKAHLLQTDDVSYSEPCSETSYKRSLSNTGSHPPQDTKEQILLSSSNVNVSRPQTALSPTHLYQSDMDQENTANKLSNSKGDQQPLLTDTKRFKSSYTRYSESNDNASCNKTTNLTLYSTSETKGDEFSTTREAQSGVKASRMFSKRFVILIIATYASMFCMVHFSMFSANALTTGVYHGDPLAAQDTEAKLLYTEGLRKSAMGSTVFYVSYFVTSIANKKLIDLFGERILFLGCHLLHATATAIFVFVQTVELFYVAMATFGPLRWALFTIPYMMANEFTNESMAPDKSSKKGNRSKAGRVVSVIAIIGPVNYLTSSASMGPLLALTRNVWLPMIFSFCGGFVSALAFLPLIFMK